MNEIKMMPVCELCKENMNFFIPSYQRGYRWTEQQVTDLLDDIWEFAESNKDGGFYCLQPLVVQKRKIDAEKKMAEVREQDTLEKRKMCLTDQWEVIDGQQRLTTLRLILSWFKFGDGENRDAFVNENIYSIRYQTRDGDFTHKEGSLANEPQSKSETSSTFLESITEASKRDDNKGKNIDFYHMAHAYETVNRWCEKNLNSLDKKKIFFEVLWEKTQFIWFVTDEQDPIKVFTRLNINKIALTDAELIKALFLNSKNKTTEAERIEIASDWDRIERTLQNDEFWLFIHDVGWGKPTRIDYILDLVREKDALQMRDLVAGNKLDGDGEKYTDVNWETYFGKDEHQTFRYFFEYFRKEKNRFLNDEIRLLEEVWKKVKGIFQVFEDWFNDVELYHYVGFLVEYDKKIGDLLDQWKQKADRQAFLGVVKDLITKVLSDKGCNDLDKTYDESGCPKKQQCRPLLLLFNLQMIINQNKALSECERYGQGNANHFPFNLFKKEGGKSNGKGWEIEHIASNAGDDLSDMKKQKIWLASFLCSCRDDLELTEEIKKFLKTDSPENFVEIQQNIEKHLSKEASLNENKNCVWNFALLDSATNEEYQNAPFAFKRICVLAKNRGQKAYLDIDEKGRIILDKQGMPSVKYEKGVSFVPSCTYGVFTKAFTDIPNSLACWTEEDAKAYKKTILETLKDFEVFSNDKGLMEDVNKKNGGVA